MDGEVHLYDEVGQKNLQKKKKKKKKAKKTAATTTDVGDVSEALDQLAV